jgi:hypothetical protein
MVAVGQWGPADEIAGGVFAEGGVGADSPGGRFPLPSEYPLGVGADPFVGRLSKPSVFPFKVGADPFDGLRAG